MNKKRVGFLFVFLLTVIFGGIYFFYQNRAEEIVVYYTNDIHGYIDNHKDENPGLSYSKVAALKNSTNNALLVDAGDHLQGTAYNSVDNGVTIIKLMNAVGYDVATLGNHEFDYGMAGCQEAIKLAKYPYISCNFRYEKDGKMGDTVLDSFVILKIGGKQIAFVGITTPETITSSSPAYFQDEDGNYIFGIDGGDDGKAIYESVQCAIDEAIAAGADYVIALGHLGVDAFSGPWTSRALIANTTGLDAFIDGHSHTTIEMETVADRAGNMVILTQTGSNLNAVGKMKIGVDGAISTKLFAAEELEQIVVDKNVNAMEDKWINEVHELLGEVIGYADVTFDNYNSQGKRLVRRQSTNTGDFVTDALYYFFNEMGMDVDIAIMNGGGIRNEAITGQLTYLSCKEIHTFGEVACLFQVTGQQVLDALEWGSKGITPDGNGENGSFLHVSGLKYTLDLTHASTVKADDKDVWVGPPTGGYRVKDVIVLNRKTGEYEPLDLNAKYNLAGYGYILKNLGGGFAMFNGAVEIKNSAAADYMVLANYIKSFPTSEVTGLPTITKESGYSNVTGSERITIISK